MFELTALEHSSNSGSRRHAVPTPVIFLHAHLTRSTRKDSRVAPWPVTRRVIVVRPLRTMDLHVRTETSSQQRQLKCSLALHQEDSLKCLRLSITMWVLHVDFMATVIFLPLSFADSGPAPPARRRSTAQTTFHQTSAGRTTPHLSLISRAAPFLHYVAKLHHQQSTPVTFVVSRSRHLSIESPATTRTVVIMGSHPRASTRDTVFDSLAELRSAETVGLVTRRVDIFSFICHCMFDLWCGAHDLLFCYFQGFIS